MASEIVEGVAQDALEARDDLASHDGFHCGRMSGVEKHDSPDHRTDEVRAAATQVQGDHAADRMSDEHHLSEPRFGDYFGEVGRKPLARIVPVAFRLRPPVSPQV